MTQTPSAKMGMPSGGRSTFAKFAAVGTHTYVGSASYKNYYVKTATTLGENTGTVDLFDAVFSVVSPAKSCTHSFTSAVTTAATCIANGKKTYTCSKCSTSYSEIIAATGVHDYVGKETTAANCVTEGVKTFTCKNCPAKYTQPIPATGTHSWGDWGVTQEATCTSTGTLTRQCSVCKQTETQTVPMIGHNYNTVTVDATCTADGSITNTCTACGDTKIGVIFAKGHDYTTVETAPTCTEAGHITSTCSNCGNVQVEEAPAIGHSYENGICTVCGAEDPNYTEPSVAPTLALKYPTVSFEGAFEINYYCVPANTPVDGVTMYYWNQADYDAAEVLTAENATAAIAMDGTGTYQAVIEGIAAKDLDKGIYVAFVYSDGTTTYSSGVLAYSIGTYCNASVDGNAGDLTKATVVYGYCAKLALYSEI